MSIFLISPVFAEPVDVEIDWTIEGQPKTIVNPSTEESIEDNYDVDLNTINEKIQKTFCRKIIHRFAWCRPDSRAHWDEIVIFEIIRKFMTL